MSEYSTPEAVPQGSTAPVQLTPVQQRVVGALAEKEMATPDNYPLSMNALLAACNQSTNRDPVVDFGEEVVDNALANLRTMGVARVVYSKGMRVDKYRHVLHEVLGLSRPELAVLAVMLLRGPQTAAELRARTERLHAFADQAEVDATLDALAGREPRLVELLDRQPGQKERRWMHLLGPGSYATPSAPREPEAPVAPEPSVAPPSPAPAAAPPAQDRIAVLEARIAALEDRLDELTRSWST